MPTTKTTPRDRLLAAADDLFFNEGIRAVGINRVLEQAKTPIMSLYRNFGSKDGLAAAYLERRANVLRAEVKDEVQSQSKSPRDAILATFDLYRDGLERNEYRGCPFINATVEMASPAHEVSRIARRVKESARDYFAELCCQLDVADPSGLSVQLTLLLDGACASAMLFQDSSGSEHARSAAEVLIDKALGAADGNAVRTANSAQPQLFSDR